MTSNTSEKSQRTLQAWTQQQRYAEAMVPIIGELYREHGVIVTLFGRLDFIEYQLAFFSRHARAQPYELIYVLDDPARARQLEILAASAFARFAIPFRIVLLAQNLGFAPANNLGLALARAPFVESLVLPASEVAASLELMRGRMNLKE